MWTEFDFCVILTLDLSALLLHDVGSSDSLKYPQCDMKFLFRAVNTLSKLWRPVLDK